MKKMAEGGIPNGGGIAGFKDLFGMPKQGGPTGTPGSGGGAQGGLDTVNQGAGQIGKSLADVGASMKQSDLALEQGRQALGGGGGGSGGGFNPMNPAFHEKPGIYKKGGAVNYTDKSGRLNLGSGRISTTTSNKSNSNW